MRKILPTRAQARADAQTEPERAARITDWTAAVFLGASCAWIIYKVIAAAVTGVFG